MHIKERQNLLHMAFIHLVALCFSLMTEDKQKKSKYVPSNLLHYLPLQILKSFLFSFLKLSITQLHLHGHQPT